MRTLLDDAHSWFLEGIVFDGDLRLTLVEAMRNVEPQDVIVGGVNLGPADQVELTTKSRRALIVFAEPVAHQVLDESLTMAYEDEVHDGGILRRYSRSRWLEYLRANSLFEHPAAEGAVHYEVLTEHDLVDVVCSEAPTVDLLGDTEGA